MNENEAILLWADEYSRMAEAYDERIAPRFAPFAARNVERAGLEPGATVLDLGTGTGLTALLAAVALGGTGLVVGIDLADGALNVARSKAARSGLRNLRFEMLDGRNIVYRGGTFDAALTSFGLPAAGHAQVLAEVHRVLKDGAAFHAVVWGPDEEQDGWAPFREALEAHRTPTPSPPLAQLREAASLPSVAEARAAMRDRDELARRMRGAGFADVASEPLRQVVRFEDVDALVRFHAGFGSVDRELAEMGDEARAAFQGDLAERFARFARDGAIPLEWSLAYVTATR